MRAGLYAAAGNYAGAAGDYAEVVRLNPRDTAALKALGDATDVSADARWLRPVMTGRSGSTQNLPQLSRRARTPLCA